MTNTVEKVDDIAYRIMRAYPHWPTTMSPCQRCGDPERYARGSDDCAECLTDELAELIDSPLLANEFKLAAKNIGFLRGQILELAKQKN